MSDARDRCRPRWPLGLAALIGLALVSGPMAHAQERPPLEEAPPADASLERVWVPRKAFTKILARHPGGVLLSEAELEALVERARAQRAAGKVPLAPDAPRLATLEELSYTGTLQGESVSLEGRARVAVQGTRTSLRLPLRGIGLTGVWVGDQPAQVVVGDRGPVVLLPGSPTPTTREIRWTFALRVQAPSTRPEEGAGQISFPVPPAASASLSLDLPREIEPLPGSLGTRWVEPASGGTRLRVAFGGGSGGQHTLLELGWRPRRTLNAAKPYVSARDQTLCTLKRGLTSLRAHVQLSVFRAPRARFLLELPQGFVVRELSSPQGEPSYLQRGERVEVVWPTPRQGLLTLQINAERPSGTQEDEQELDLRPLRVLEVDRSGGVLALAAGPDTVIRFPDPSAAGGSLERADLNAFDSRLTPPGADEGLVRVYRHVQGVGALPVFQRRLAPQIALGIQAAIQVEAREVKALAFYRYSVEAGAVYTVRAQLPPGFSLEDVLVRDGQGQRPEHRFSERVQPDGSLELIVELDQGLRAPSELLLTVQCAREVPQGVTSAPLAIPRFLGTPRTELRGLFGFATDPTFRLSGRKLKGLLAIPAADLPRAGLEAEGLVLGYRVEGLGYEGQLSVTRRETRLSVEQTEHHTLGERLLTSQFNLALDLGGAPLQELDLWFPAGSGALATIRGPGLLREREKLETKEGRERWRLAFQEPWSGQRAIQVDFQTALGGAEGPSQVTLPQVTLADAFRQRGTLAVFSSGEAELQATPRGLRPLDVTEAPALSKAGASETKRPLWVYRWVRPDHGLTLGLSRPGQTPVLSAVAEHLHLATSAAADGTARHVARFEVRNLDNQFFGLVLPEGATLWSVAVNGEGVKPAAREGVLLIPIPDAGKDASKGTLIQAAYTQATTPWGWFGEAELHAPALTFGANAEDTVPILRTTWALSLPEDVRALEVAGNLEGATQRSFVEPLLRQGWRAWRHETLPWLLLGLAIPGLLIVTSGRGRAGLFRLAQGAYGAGGACRSVAVDLPWKRIFLVGAGLVALVALLGLCLSSGLMAEDRRPQTKETQPSLDHFLGDSAEPAKSSAGQARNSSSHFADEGELAMDPASQPRPRRQGLAERERGHRRSEPRSKLKEHRKVKPRKKGRPQPAKPAPMAPPAAKPGAQLPSEPSPEPEPETLTRARKLELRPPVDVPARSAGDGDGKGVEDDEVASGEELPAEVMDEVSGSEVAKDGDKAPMAADLLDKERYMETDLVDSYGVGGGAAGAYGQQWGKGSLEGRGGGDPGPDLAAGLNQRAGKLAGKGAPAARISELGAGGEVGLRSLVLELGAVGESDSFHRSGGGATLRLSLAAERLFVVLGGLFAAFGFLGAFLVPASRRVSGLSLVVVGLAGATLFPLIWASPLVGALSNALTLGFLAAAPVLALGALTRAWKTRPFGRLLSALRAA